MLHPLRDLLQFSARFRRFDEGDVRAAVATSIDSIDGLVQAVHLARVGAGENDEVRIALGLHSRFDL